MPLIPYEPFRQLEHMRRDMDRFFGVGQLHVDLYETDEDVVAVCDMPGLEKQEDVSIDIENQILTISGTVNRMNEGSDGRMHRRERYAGQFQRSIGLPARVNAEDVKATYKNGVLEIRLPKLQIEQRKKIDVKFH